MSATTTTPSGGAPSGTLTTVGLKEWGAVAAALLDGRQTLLLRKGGIHEKRFAVDRDRFVLFPTVAHSHADRVRPEHRDVLESGAADVQEARNTFTVRCGVELVAVVPVERPENLDTIEDLHIWTADSVREDRIEFRPKHALQALVVRAHALEPVTLERREEYGGCRSWVELPVAWPSGTGEVVHTDERLRADAERVRRAVG